MGRERLVRRAVRRRFLVTTDSEESFDGVLSEWDEGFFVFADVSSIGPKGDRVRLDQVLWVPRYRIKYMQAVNS